MALIRVYGAEWCGMTRHTLAHLDRLGVEYDYVNIERDRRAAEWVKRHANGKEKKPTLDIDGRVLVAPDDEEIDEVLRELHVLTT